VRGVRSIGALGLWLVACVGGLVAWSASAARDRAWQEAAWSRFEALAGAAAGVVGPTSTASDAAARQADLLGRVRTGAPELESVQVYRRRDGDYELHADVGADAAAARVVLPPESVQALEAKRAVRGSEPGRAFVLAPLDGGFVRVTFSAASFDAPSALTPWLLALLGALAAAFVLHKRAGQTPAPQENRELQDLVQRRVQSREREFEIGKRQTEEFVANTVHELRTPLTTILASLDMMREGYAETPEDEREFIEQATVACRHLMLLVNDLLDTAAFDSGRLHLEVAPVSANEILHLAEKLMRPVAVGRGLELQVVTPPADVIVSGDQMRILQVLFNLLSNAMKFSTAPAPVVLRCTIDRLVIAFEIEDQGIGVPLETRSKLFTRYGRAHEGSSSGSQIGGTGIGLYLCKALIDQMQGSIGYRAREPGPGSVFWFTLPIVAAPEHATAGAAGKDRHAR
jgi:signal transduction histidine kinase